MIGAVFSSAAGWGGAAFVVASFAQRPWAAVRIAAGVLVLATVTYYLVIIVVTQRWQAGDDAWSGLRSVARATGFWLLGSVAGGLIVGRLAHLAAHGRVRFRSVALGVTLGLLSSQGCWEFVFLLRWWQGPLDGYGWRGMELAAVEVAVAVLVVALLRRRGRPVSWPWLLGGLGLSLPAAVAVWSVVDAARTSL